MLNKKAMSIPIVLLVLLTLVLTTISLFYFITKDKEVKETMQIPEIIEVIYIEEAQLNYYLQEIFDNSVKDFKFEDGKQKFINNFKNELKNYAIIDSFEQIESQVIEDNIELTNEKIVLELNINLIKSQEIGEKEVISINYNYKKIFEKDL